MTAAGEPIEGGGGEIVSSPAIALIADQASDNGRGALASLWSAGGGAMELFASTKQTGAIFQMPLTGNFAVTCKTRLTESSAMLPTYGDIGVYPGENKTLYRFAANGSGQIIVSIENMDQLPEWSDYILEVAAGIVKISLNGKKVLREKLST